MANHIRLYPWELESMREYSSTLPSGTVLWKMWKRNLNFGMRSKEKSWVVGQYVPYTGDLPDQIGIRWFEIQLLEGPRPTMYEPPDWDNYARWQREYEAGKKGQP